MTRTRRPFPTFGAMVGAGGYSVLGVLWLAFPPDPATVPVLAKVIALAAAVAAGGGVVAVGDWWGSDR